MTRKSESLRQRLRTFTLLALAAWASSVPASEPEETTPDPAAGEPSPWTQVVRASPYWVSQGVYQNVLTLRRWVLEGRSYCAEPDRHILYDMRGRFLAWLSDGDDRAETQARLNDTREALAKRGAVDTWLPGQEGQAGYPFALSCDQPFADLDEAIDRLVGTDPDDRLWGRWDTLDFASEDHPRSLAEALWYVYQNRVEAGRLSLPAGLIHHLAGQILIESGARRQAHSAANARGIFQLSPTALSDCEIRPDNVWHRLAQIDCALRLTAQNARNLRPAFEARFGDLPEDKQEALFHLLLIQAYHGGAGRVTALLEDPELSRPAAYFAEHADRFSAGDIAFGMVFHNLGRDRLGLASLYYVADVELASEALCRRWQRDAADATTADDFTAGLCPGPPPAD